MFKAFGFTATMHQESGFMCGFHMSHEELHSMSYDSPNLDTISREHALPFAQASTFFSCINIFIWHPFFPPSTSIYTHPLPVHLPLTCGQVCPCVASSNRKCIMDVTFLSISTTKSHTPLCSQ